MLQQLRLALDSVWLRLGEQYSSRLKLGEQYSSDWVEKITPLSQ